MERWDYKSLKQQHGQYRTSSAAATTREKEQQYPSFSSTLLDSIYRSIDETNGEICATETTTMRGNKQVCSKEEDVANYKRAFLIEKWTEKKKLATSGCEKHATSTTIVRQKSMADYHRGPTKSTSSGKMKNQNLSSSSNSDSSFSGRLSSPEAESNYNNNISCGGSTLLSDFKYPQKPKPIRTTSHHQSEMSRKKYEASSSDRQVENKSKHETFNNYNTRSTSTSTSSNSNVAATKMKKLTRALKIYSDLKKTTMRGNKQVCSKEEDVANYKRAFLIEKWTEKKKLATSGCEKHATSTTIVRQKSMADYHRGPTKSTSSGKMKNQNLSSSSNSDSSFSGRLSSPEAESNYNNNISCGGSTLLSDFKYPQKPKPIRTTSHHQSEMSRKKYEASSSDRQVENKSKHETFNNYNTRSTSTSTSSNSNVAATKMKKLTRALKIYSDLKKTKQPISPGGRLAGFINSLFTNGNTKQQNSGNSRSTTQFDAKSPYSSNCSSASSFSRSCLSKGSLNSNGAAGEKRSVRFYPVSVIVDEDCRPCGQKSLHEDPHHLQIVEQQKSRHVDLDMKFVTEAFDDDDDEDDDDVSCTSSDLFELDNLGSIGIDCYREELPVYETTRFDLNRVVSKGLIV